MLLHFHSLVSEGKLRESYARSCLFFKTAFHAAFKLRNESVNKVKTIKILKSSNFNLIIIIKKTIMFAAPPCPLSQLCLS